MRSVIIFQINTFPRSSMDIIKDIERKNG
jgi:hypothetical protein